MVIQIKKAVKYDSKLRMALAGPSGSGKTYTALTLATALAGDKGVCVIDTERGSASKYADIFEFDVIDLDNFHPNNYIEAIAAAQEAGYGVLVIDSLSHAWNGPGGLLEIVENITKRSQNKSSFNAWGEATPLQNRLIDAITRAGLHVIVTMRTKTEYVIEQNERGRSAPRKVGMAPVQRADVEYEFDVYADMSIDNEMIIQKSRCSALAGQVIPKPDARVAGVLSEWLQGAPSPVLHPSDIEALKSEWAIACAIPDDEIETRWPKYLKFLLKIAEPDLTAFHLPTIRRDLEQRSKQAS